MRFDVPECKRCLFCLPLRYGIIVFGYLNLLFTVFLVVVSAWSGEEATTPTFSMYRGVTLFTQMWLPMVLYTLEMIFNIALIVGAHMKKKGLLRAFYYYGMTTTVATFFVVVVLKFHEATSTIVSTHIIDILVTICGFLVHIYMLLLVRTELSKSRYQSGVIFINQIAEVVSPPPWGDGRNPF